jgi:hypothetical protein
MFSDILLSENMMLLDNIMLSKNMLSDNKMLSEHNFPFFVLFPSKFTISIYSKHGIWTHAVRENKANLIIKLKKYYIYLNSLHIYISNANSEWQSNNRLYKWVSTNIIKIS